MKLNLTGKRVFISGSSRGIGLSIASKFLEEGARVILNSRNLKDLEDIAKKIQNLTLFKEMFQITKKRKK